MNTTVYLNIGSNSGDCRAYLARAVAALVSAFPDASVRLSEAVESEPWGYESPNPYLNTGVALTMCREAPWDDASLLDLLDAVQAAERSVSPAPHRNPDGSYRDREVDIDIIAVDTLIFKHPHLTLPHPRMHLRPFVLIPMQTLAPDWRHPLLALTPSALLDTLQ